MAARESWIKRLHLPPDQLAILSAQVNRICGLEPGDFKPESHLQEVRSIIFHIDPYVTERGHLHISLVDNDDDSSQSVRGGRAVTNLGSLFSIPDPKKTTQEIARFGKRDGIGIGSYIAEKDKGKHDTSVLSFTPFMDHNLASLDPESSRPYRRIMYRQNTLEPTQITKEEPRVRFGFLVTYTSLPIWKAK